MSAPLTPAAPPAATAAAGKAPVLAWLALSQLLIMSLWFSASAVVPQLRIAWDLGPSATAWLTMSVQLGFAGGEVASALLTLSDRVRPPRLIAASGLTGALCTAAITVTDDTWVVFALRVLTGAAMAGVYPPGMKLVSTWTTRDRGLGIGVLVGAITLGSAMPHLLNATPSGMPPWRTALLGAAALATAGALIAGTRLRPGPHLAASAPFDWRFAGRALAHRPTRLANVGYLGHMWELYAMWAWVPIFLLASYERAGLDVRAARLAGFATMGAGAAGSVLAGVLADRVGRTRVTIVSLAISGGCAVVAGFLFSAPVALTVVCLVWGFAVVADSAQFSTAVTELTDRRYVGTALTVQTCLGFLLTVATLQIVPWLLARGGWHVVFPVLAIGPACGIAAMAALRRMPEARRMASGNR